jgi:acetyl esterase/lipase
VDVFPCGRSAAPTLVYIHGGYWQMKHDHFSILEELARPNGAILTALKDLALTP